MSGQVVNKPTDRLAMIIAMEGKFIQVNGHWTKVKNSFFHLDYGDFCLRNYQIDRLERWLLTAQDEPPQEAS